MSPTSLFSLVWILGVKIINITMASSLSCKETDQVPAVHAIPHYHHDRNSPMELLEQIDSTFIDMPQNISGIGSYVITYSDANSNKVCMSESIPVSSCTNMESMLCHHTYKSSSSKCDCHSNINVTLSLTSSSDCYVKPATDPVMIEAVNTLVQVSLSFKKGSSFINCTFLSQPAKVEKTCEVMYGPATTAGCTSSQLIASTDLSVTESSSMLMDVDLSFVSTREAIVLCLSVTARSGGNVVNVEGVFGSESDINGSPRSTPSLLVIVAMLILIFLFTLMIRHLYQQIRTIFNKFYKSR